MSEVSTSDIVLDSFETAWRTWRKGSYTHHIDKGGRNSAKSTHVALDIILDIIDLPVNSLVIRKVADTLEGSVYEQLKKAVYYYGVENDFKFRRAPLLITYLPRGNFVCFRGADKPEKIKSITTSEFPIARVWFEEVTEFKLEEEVQTIVDSILRDTLPDGLTYKFFYTYNPPKRKQHWVNKKYESVLISSDTYVHHSSYVDNHYLSDQTLAGIENYRREKGEERYRWYYLGEPLGGGVVPFENLKFRTITTEEVEHFDNIRQGVDWGYAGAPVAFVRMHYDKREKKLFFLDEVVELQLSNFKLCEKLKKVGYNQVSTMADCEEPKSISECKDYGVRMRACTKGAGSVEYGEKWLNDLTEIVIDPKRTPRTAVQWENIDYVVDKDGNVGDRLEDKENDTIDATRYALENDMGRSGVRILTN